MRRRLGPPPGPRPPALIGPLGAGPAPSPSSPPPPRAAGSGARGAHVFAESLITEGEAVLLCIKICLSSFYLNFKENVNQFYFNKMTLSRGKKKLVLFAQTGKLISLS